MKAPWRVRKGYQTYSDELFRENHEHLEMYLEETWAVADHDDVIAEFEENPHAGSVIVNDFINNRKDPEINREKLFDIISLPSSGVIMISGSKGSGKTYIAFDIAYEMHQRGYRVVWVGPPISLPDWIAYAPDISHLKEGDFAIIDEAANAINSRRAMSTRNVETTERFPTLRHAGVKVLIITQSTKRVDVSVVEFADVHIKKEYSAIYAAKTERFNDDLYDKYFNFGMQEWSFVRSATFVGMVMGNELEWYDDTIGKPYSLFKNKKVAKEFLMSMIDAEMDANSIKTEMNVRGCKKSKKEWVKIIDNYEQFGTLKEEDNRQALIDAGVKNPDIVLAEA